jgi:hypothetical protein
LLIVSLMANSKSRSVGIAGSRGGSRSAAKTLRIGPDDHGIRHRDDFVYWQLGDLGMLCDGLRAARSPPSCDSFSIAVRQRRASATLPNDLRIFLPSRFAYAAASKLGEQSQGPSCRDAQDREWRTRTPSGTFFGSRPTLMATLQVNWHAPA